MFAFPRLDATAGRSAGTRARIVGSVGIVSLCLLVGPMAAFGQRIMFPTADPTATAAPAVAANPAPPYAATPMATSAPTTVMTPFGPAPTAATAPALPGATPPNALTFGPAPVATLNGTVQPVSPGFDPFAPPGTAPVAVVAPQDPYYGAPCPQPAVFAMPATMEQAYRLLHDVNLDYHWFYGHGSNPSQLGINDIESSAHLALPFGSQPLLVGAGFAFHFWDGPATTAPNFADMPARTYDAYLDTMWNPQFSPGFGAELDARVGIYSDFTELINQSYRVSGKGMAVFTLPDPAFKLKAGVWYINRAQIKLLPAGGLVWTPSPFTRIDILFPNPRFTQQLTAVGNVEWWWYFSGDYGGGTWTIKRAGEADPAVANQIDLVEYDDIRLALGIEFKRHAGMTGFFEGGYAFDRQLVYRSLHPATWRPDNTYYIHAGITF